MAPHPLWSLAGSLTCHRSAHFRQHISQTSRPTLRPSFFSPGCTETIFFAAGVFRHHPLLLGEDGRKLSKSDGTLSLAALRAKGCLLMEVYQMVARQAGIDPDGIATLEDLLFGFCEIS